MSTDVTMRILLSASSGNTMSVINSVTGALTGGGGLMGALAGVGAAAAGFALSFGAASVKAAGDFQATMNKIQALAGVSKDQAAQASEAILKMSTVVGQTPQQLADGLYYIASAGYSAKDALTILEASAKAASVGMTDTETVANAVTATMKALNLPASQTNRILDEMTKTVSLGKTEWDDYAKIVGKLALNASQAKVSFEETNSAFSQLTNVMPSSRQAADSLNALLQTSSRFDLLKQRADSLGISFDENRYKTMNLEERMRYLMDVTGGNTEELNKLLGRQNAVNALTALATNNFKNYDEALKQVKNSSGAAEEAFQKVAGGWNMSTQRMGAAFEMVKVRVGTALLPVLTQLVNLATPLVASLGNIFDKTSPLAPIFEQVGGAIRVMASNWADLAAGAGPTLNAFKQFGDMAAKLAGGVIVQFLRYMMDLNVLFVTIAQSVQGWVAPALKILEQIFQGAQGYIAQVVDVFESQLIPAYQNLVTAIAPVVQSMLEWIASTGVISMVFQGLGFIMTHVIPVIAGIVNGVANVIKWLQQWSIITNILKVTLALAFAPILIAIGAVVVAIMAIVFIVQLVISAWQALPAFWSGLWSRIVSLATGAWSAIVAGARAAWAWITGVVRAGAALLLNLVMTPIRNIGAAFVWLYNHNYYFKALIDTIRNVTAAGLAWLQGAWSASIAWLTGVWRGAVGLATGAWNAVTGAISSAASAAWSFLVGVWNNAIGWLSGKWNGMMGLAQGAWSRVSGVFGSAWATYISGPLSSLWSSISGWFNNLKDSALAWGQNMIQGFIDGIRSMAAQVGQAAQDVMQQAANVLGFHSPAKEGPGAELDIWGPNLVKGFSEGMLKALPVLDAAVNVTANHLVPMATPPPRAASLSSQVRGSVVVNHYHNYNIQTMARSQSEVRRFVDMIEAEQGKRVHIQTPGYASGGVF